MNLWNGISSSFLQQEPGTQISLFFTYHILVLGARRVRRVSENPPIQREHFEIISYCLGTVLIPKSKPLFLNFMTSVSYLQ